ncbi:RHS repeat protein [Rubinisphaera margarita]|uniref:RHS repeat protein n=1 Tax=Rubinisphaera margarita TaxID=2909586 RepID=UPI001EE937CA|nr:RHS repeat protein [Rubinisphaera margarita]MCG6154467.1 hypothetical protein [Rubinisphaera margarita]
MISSKGTTITAYQYAYDSVGNRLSRVDLQQSEENVTLWQYDAANRLTQEGTADALSWDTLTVEEWGTLTVNEWAEQPVSRTAEGVTTWSDDPAGNRVTQETASGTTTYTYDAANQLTSSEDASGVTTYTYDANGNQTRVETPDSSITTTTWTYENQRSVVTQPDGAATTFTYSLVNRSGDEYCVEKQTPSETKLLIWDNNNVLQEYAPGGATQVQYVSQPRKYGLLLHDFSVGGTRYYHFDGFHSTSAITDESETIVSRVPCPHSQGHAYVWYRIRRVAPVAPLPGPTKSAGGDGLSGRSSLANLLWLRHPG